jgi:anti-anti-sigma regulatory factor
MALDAHDPRQRWLGRTAVVSASGPLDLLTSPRLEQLLTSTLQERPAGLIVDLTEVFNVVPTLEAATALLS